LAQAKGVRCVRWLGLFWRNPSTGRLDGLLGSMMSVWTQQNLRKYHWIAFGGVFYRLENNKTLVNGDWNAMY
jgi:hypothetical protein